MKTVIFFRSVLISLLCLTFQITNSYAEVQSNQLPTGANVVSGQITINEEPGKLTINQTTAKGIIEWKTFNLGSNASIFFNHSNASDSVLNQVLDFRQSTILGKIYSNGKLFINNPNGISLGAGASINAHSFVASAMKLANHDFLNRNYYFTQDKDASIENLGEIKAQYVALMAPNVKNKGVITSKNGATYLAASDDMILTINQDQTINVKVNPSKIKATASNEGMIISENGVVTIRADMAQDAIAATIKAPENQANSLVSKNGVIKLVSNSGTIKARKVTLDAGERGAVVSSGSIDTSSSTANGGSIELIGKEVILKSGSVIQSTGVQQGGNIYIGNPTILKTTSINTFVTMEQNTLINVSSLNESAGVVEIRSTNANERNQGGGRGSLTSVDGIILARSAGSRRKGLGQVIISGYDVNLNKIFIDATNNVDIGGDIVVESYNDVIGGRISLISNGKIEGGGVNVVSLFGDINFQESMIQTNASSGRGGTIGFNANQNIIINDANLYARGSPDGGTITLISSENNVNLQNSLIQTNGGTGRGGTIEISGYNQTIIQSSTIESKGQNKGGNIYIGNNYYEKSIPFSQYTLIDPYSVLDATSSNIGGFIETSGHVLDLFAPINVGFGGLWLIDPYDVTIASSGASGNSYSTSFTPSTNTVLLA